MRGYPYIKDLFTSILTNSKAIQGRFYISHLYGAQEINSDVLGQVLAESNVQPKYPLVLMTPPHGMFKPDPNFQGGEWRTFRIITYWCKLTYYDAYGETTNPNPKTKTSLHSVMEDWHDMERCAINFTRALKKLQHEIKPCHFILESNQILTVPFSIIGTDRVSGVKMDFDFKLHVDCVKEDYDEYPSTLTIQTDSHAEHEL